MSALQDFDHITYAECKVLHHTAHASGLRHDLFGILSSLLQ